MNNISHIYPGLIITAHSFLQSPLTYDPVHFFHVVTIATVAAFASKGRGGEEGCVDVCQREEEEERLIRIPKEDRGEEERRGEYGIERETV